MLKFQEEYKKLKVGIPTGIPHSPTWLGGRNEEGVAVDNVGYGGVGLAMKSVGDLEEGGGWVWNAWSGEKKRK